MRRDFLRSSYNARGCEIVFPFQLLINCSRIPFTRWVVQSRTLSSTANTAEYNMNSTAQKWTLHSIVHEITVRRFSGRLSDITPSTQIEEGPLPFWWSQTILNAQWNSSFFPKVTLSFATYILEKLLRRFWPRCINSKNNNYIWVMTGVSYMNKPQSEKLDLMLMKQNIKKSNS